MHGQCMCTVLRMHGQFILHVLHCSLVGITAILYELLCCMLETLKSCLHMFSHLYVLTAQANQPVSFLLHKRIYSACVSEAWLNLCPKSGMHHMWLPYSVCSCPPTPPRGFHVHPRMPAKPQAHKSQGPVQAMSNCNPSYAPTHGLLSYVAPCKAYISCQLAIAQQPLYNTLDPCRICTSLTLIVTGVSTIRCWKLATQTRP